MSSNGEALSLRHLRILGRCGCCCYLVFTLHMCRLTTKEQFIVSLSGRISVAANQFFRLIAQYRRVLQIHNDHCGGRFLVVGDHEA